MDSFMKSTNENIQNPEVISSSMHEIPLSTEEQEEQVLGTIEKIPSKSSSLKRFFKLSSIRKGSSEAMAVAKNLDADAGAEADVEEGNEEEKHTDTENNAEDTDNSDLTSSKAGNQGVKRDRSRRFNFRFSSNAENPDAPTSSNNAPTPSKHSLRGSLSTYFNSVFKRKQGASSKHTLRSSKKKDAKTDDENDNGIEMVQTTTTTGPDQNKETQEAVGQESSTKNDDVQNLNISDENSENTATTTPTMPQA